MRGRIEYANGPRMPSRSSTFPASWGPPPLDECERAGWVAAHVDSSRGVRVRALMPGQEHATAPPAARGGVQPAVAHRLRLLELAARRTCPW